MCKKFALWILVGVALTAVGLTLFSFAAPEDEVKRVDAIRVIAERVCLKLEPPIEAFPEDQQYEVLANALAAKGITNFVGTDPEEVLTIADMKEIFDAVTGGEEIAYELDRRWCPFETTAILAKGPDQNIGFEDFRKVADCFPWCDFATAETYMVPPSERYVPPGPGPTPEEPSTEIY
jgi:hypothetical protein